jgi:hypothetical protein
MDLANRSGVRETHPSGVGKSICLMDLANRSGVPATHQQVENQICNSNWFVDSFHLAINQRDRFPQD